MWRSNFLYISIFAKVDCELLETPSREQEIAGTESRLRSEG